MKNGDKISIVAAPPQVHEMLENIPDTLKNLHLTCVTPDGTVTFARDNAQDCYCNAQNYTMTSAAGMRSS